MNTSIEFSGLTQWLADKIGLPQPVLFALTIGALLGWICWRTRSTHVVITRIWRLIFGKTAMADREIGKFIENRNRLVTFRFFSGMPVRTLAQAKRLLHWSAAHDEEIADIRACGDLFDLEACRLREERIPGRPLQVFQVLLLAGLAGVVILAGYGLRMDQALLQFKESQKWFWLSDTNAVPLGGEGLVSKKACLDDALPPPNRTSFSDDEVSIICKAFRDSDTPAFVEKTVAQMRALLAPIGVVLLYWAWQCWLLFRCGIFARNIQQRISTSKKASKGKTDEPNIQATPPGRSPSSLPTRHREDADATVSA